MTASRLAAGAMLRYTARWGMWTCVVIALAFTAISAGVATWGTPGSATSVWASVAWTLNWVAFGGGIAVGWYLPVLVAHGLTRRSTTAAAGLSVAALALALAVLVQAGLAAEWLIYRAGGLPHLVGGGHLFRTIGEVHLVLAEHVLMFGALLTSGLLMFVTYYRLGRRRGTLALPLALVPAAGTLFALSAGRPADTDSPPWVATIGSAAAMALAVAAIAAGLVTLSALTRTMPIRSK